MAQLTVFEYRPGTTLLHQLDIRCKIVALVLVNVTSFSASWPGLLLLSLLICILFISLRIPLLTTLSNIRLFFLILFFILISRALSIVGEEALDLGFLSLSKEGLLSGAVYCWRLINIFLAGIVFVRTAGVTEIKSGIQWFLKPLPFIPEKRVAVMLGLMIRFLPLIMQQSSDISQAQKARGVESRKNPVKRLTLHSLPLFRRVFETADRLALAMEARCFSESRTDPGLRLKPVDCVLLLLLMGFCSISVML